MYLLHLVILVSTWYVSLVQNTVLSPPWNDIKINPCANKPNGWQLLYWPKDGQCYRIFQKGHPCPDTMELTPGRNGTAECKCPPGTAQNPRNARCYKTYNQGPCNKNEYFGPVKKTTQNSASHKWGACFEIDECEKGKVFWAKDGKCYGILSKGPCAEGLLLKVNDRLGECSCNNSIMPANYWEPGSSCHEHFLQGPCKTGELFLPNGLCGCNESMTNFFPEDKKCYATGSQGPCKEGNIFLTNKIKSSNESIYGECVCKEGYVLWKENGLCYQPFTQGPCSIGEMLDIYYKKNESSLECVQVPCATGELFFPGKGCHQIGTQGPCLKGEMVQYQAGTNLSGNETSYLGVCGCGTTQDQYRSIYVNDIPSLKNKCPNQQTEDVETVTSSNNEAISTDDICLSNHGYVLWRDQSCWQLYSQGPCKNGEWLVPDRGKGQKDGRWRMGKCECRPGYTTLLSKNDKSCILHTESLTKFLSSKLE